jgi:hypothetical protein
VFIGGFKTKANKKKKPSLRRNAWRRSTTFLGAILTENVSAVRALRAMIGRNERRRWRAVPCTASSSHEMIDLSCVFTVSNFQNSNHAWDYVRATITVVDRTTTMEA